MKDIPDKRYFRPIELAKEMCLNVETIRRWMRDGRIKHLDLPKGQLIPHDEYFYVIQNGPRAKSCSAL